MFMLHLAIYGFAWLSSMKYVCKRTGHNIDEF